MLTIHDWGDIVAAIATLLGIAGVIWAALKRWRKAGTDAAVKAFQDSDRMGDLEKAFKEFKEEARRRLVALETSAQKREDRLQRLERRKRWL